MKKCYVITSYIDGALSGIISPGKSDFIICADGGYEIAASCGIKPDLVIGDSDSGKMNGRDGDTKFIRFPSEKDYSDTFLCVKHAVSLGFEDIIIAGGIGGRLDHTMSNIQTIACFSDTVPRLTMLDETNIVTLISDSHISISPKEGFTVSLFSYSDVCRGVTAAGLYYPLTDAELKNTDPVGLSNKFTEADAFIEVKKGKLLVVMSKIL